MMKPYLSLSPLSTLRLYVAPFNMSTNGIGRHADVNHVFDKLVSTNKPLVITGEGSGSMKMLLQMFWYEHEAAFDNVAFLIVDRQLSPKPLSDKDKAALFLEAFVRNEQLISRLGLSFVPTEDDSTRFALLIEALTEVAGLNLLVIQNATAAATAHIAALAQMPNWKILITSQEPIPNTTTFELGALSNADAATLFMRTYKGAVEPESLDTILREVNCDTLAIEMMAAYAREKDLAIDELEEELLAHVFWQLDDDQTHTPKRNEKAKRVIEYLLHKFLKAHDRREEEILRYFTLLPATGKSFGFLPMNIEHLAVYFQKEDTKVSFHNILNNLMRHKWVQKRYCTYFSYSDLKEIMYKHLKPNAVNCQKLILSFNDLLHYALYSGDDLSKHKHLEPLAAHILRGCYDASKTPTDADKILAILADRLRAFHVKTGDYHTALKYGNICFVLNEAIFGAHHMDVATAYTHLAFLHRNLGHLTESKTQLEQAIAIWSKKLNPDHLLLKTAYAQWTTICAEIADAEKAQIDAFQIVVHKREERAIV